MSTGKSSHDKLLKLQKQIFRSLESEARALVGAPPAAIRRYEREFQRDFRAERLARARALSKNRLLDSIRAADVSFIADYHTFDQAQRTAFRLIRDAIRPDESWLIGLELIPSHYQLALDNYQSGRLTLDDFHRLIRYREDWGFPWKNYAPIFEWARKHGVGLVALNRPKELIYLRRARDAASHGHTDLHERDQWAAGLITDRFADARARDKRQRLRMIVLYGELHVASQHLPMQLTKISRAFLGRPLRSITVHQNYDRLYWRLAARGDELRKDILKLEQDVYCVLSGTPWAKLQSLVSWAEGGEPHAAETGPDSGRGLEEDEDAAAFATDYLSLMRTYAEAVARFLDLRSPSFDALNVLSIDEADFADHLDRGQFSAGEIAVIRFHVRHGLRLYIPRTRIAYIAAPSQNAAADLASIHLLRSHTGSPAFGIGTEEDFHRAALESTFGFFGSLVLNPRRKCDLPADHRRRLRELAAGARAAFPKERETRQLALLAGARSTSRGLGRGIARAIANPRLAPAVYIAARLAGQILAKRLHQAVLREGVGLDDVRRLLLSRPGPRESFAERRAELQDLVRGHASTRSKRTSL